MYKVSCNDGHTRVLLPDSNRVLLVDTWPIDQVLELLGLNA